MKSLTMAYATYIITCFHHLIKNFIEIFDIISAKGAV